MKDDDFEFESTPALSFLPLPDDQDLDSFPHPI